MARAAKAIAKAPARRQRPAPAQPRPAKSAKANKKPAKRTGTISLMRSALDARIPAHLPPPSVTGPYSVVRDLCRATITTGGTKTVMVIGAYENGYSGPSSNDSLQPNYCPILGYYGAGTTAPASWNPVASQWATSRQASLVSGEAVKATVCLHSLTVSIQNSKGTALCEGFVYVGNLTGCPNRGNFPDAATAYDNFVRRAGVKRHSAVELAANALDVCAYPVDVTQWSMLEPLVEGTFGEAALETHSKDTLSHIVIAWDPTSTPITYSVEISTEWRVVYNNDVELASTHTHHPPATNAIWSSVVRGAEAVGGEIANAVMPGAMQAFGGMVKGAARAAGKALGLAGRKAPLMLTLG